MPKFEVAELIVSVPEHRTGATKYYDFERGFRMQLDTDLNGVVVTTPKGEDWLCSASNYVWLRFMTPDELAKKKVKNTGTSKKS